MGMDVANQQLGLGVFLAIVAALCVTILPRSAASHSAAAQPLFDSTRALIKTSNVVGACSRMTRVDVPWIRP
jgi:hypothetical protein